MKQKSIIAVICIIFIVSFNFSALAQGENISTDEMLEKNAKILFSDIDFSKAELSEVKKLYYEKKYDDALCAYKTIWIEDFIDLNDNGAISIWGNTEAWLNKKDAADRLVNEDTVVITDRSNVDMEMYLGTPGNYNWGIAADADNSDSSHFAEYTNMYFTGALSGTYMNSEFNDVKYLDKWLDIWMDYDINFVKKGTQTELNAQTYVDSGFISCLKLERINGARFRALYEMLKFNKEEVMSRMSNAHFSNMLIRSLDKLQKVNLYIDQPNQSITGSQAAMIVYSYLSDFKSANSRLPLILERFKTNQNKNFVHDGTDVEHDMKYNRGYVNNTLAIKYCFDALEMEYPDYFDELIENCKLRLRALVSCTTPKGKHPNIADSYEDTMIEFNNLMECSKQLGGDELVEDISNIILNGFAEDNQPAFTSIAFPYAGFYNMRSSWEKDAQYMFFYGPRWSGGHSCDSHLGIMLFANGERLLIDAGGQSYGEMDIGDYLEYSYAHNTLTADDLTQGWMYRDYIDPGNADYSTQTPIDGYWHTNDRFDFASGTYDDGYTSSKGRNHYLNNISEKEITDVVHNRFVINDKENEISVVYDSVKTSLKHKLSINWNFAKKFDNYGTVFADSEDKSIKTTLDDGKAGINIYNFTQNEISYKVTCGEYGEGTGEPTEGSSGWTLPNYGVEYKPTNHVSSYFDSNCSKQGVVSLLVPKMNNEEPFKKVETICTNQGFRATKHNGTVITCVGAQKDSTAIKTGDFNLNAKLFYLVQKEDGTTWGMAIGCNRITYKGKRYNLKSGSFEFEIKDGKFIYKDTITKPTDFKWIETENGTVPYYGADIDTNHNIRY